MHTGEWKVDRHTRQGELFVTTGNIPALRNLIKRWKCNPICSGDKRLSMFRERLAEMEAIEASHGIGSLTIFLDAKHRQCAPTADQEQFIRRVNNADALAKLMGSDWWQWSHRSCLQATPEHL